MQFHLRDETETEAFGARLYRCLPTQSLIYLEGQLGAGKTTLVRGYLRAAGYLGAVKSPTYTLVEEYEIDHEKIVHFDLYRLAYPEELEWIGIRDYLSSHAVCFVEWPSMGQGILPEPDLSVHLLIEGSGRRAIIGKISQDLEKLLNNL